MKRTRGKSASRNSDEQGGLPSGQDPELLRRLLRAKDRMDAASHEDWPVQRLRFVLVDANPVSGQDWLVA